MSKPERKRAKPRNPLVALAAFRKAGAHGKTGKAIRLAEKMKLLKSSFESPFCRA